MIRNGSQAAVATKWRLLRNSLDERGQRLWAATEASSLGHGGIMVVHRATGLARSTIGQGLRELGLRGAPSAEISPRRVRRAGAGRKKLVDTDPTLKRDVERLVNPSTRGDPMSPLLWTSKSAQNIANELNMNGHRAGPNTVNGVLKDLGYSMQGNRKVKEGASHPDRDAQFHYINQRVQQAHAKGEPCVSVDTKKKELVGDFKNGGKEWHPRFNPTEVNVHDFMDKEKGKAIPYGVYDIARNEACVSVGIDHDTAQFAVGSLGYWHKEMGRSAYPQARELTITADCGGSNGYRARLWKLELQAFADKTGLIIHVHHFPPGTSKWNKIEHRLFCQITRNWRARPLTDLEVIISLIASTTTATGLCVKAALDARAYPKGIKVTDEQMDTLNIRNHDFHGDWNYTISPRPKAR